MAKLFPPGYVFTHNGSPVSSGGVVFYANGTTNAKTVYTDSALSNAATNSTTTTPKGQPLGSDGRFTQGDLYGSGLYTVVLFDSAGGTIWSRNDFSPSDGTNLSIADTSGDHFYTYGVSELAADRTITLPLLTGNDEFVFKDHAVTLTNKTLTGPIMTAPIMTIPQIQDTSSDHQYVFAVSELAADRTVTLPLLTGNDEFVFKDHAVTLTNKTMTFGNNTITMTLAQLNTAITDANVPSVGVLMYYGSI